MNTKWKAAFVLNPETVLEALPVSQKWTPRLALLEQRDRPRSITLSDLDRRRLTRPVRTTVAIMGAAGHLARLLNGPAGRTLVGVWSRLDWIGLGIYLNRETTSDHPLLSKQGLPREKVDLPNEEVDRALWEVVFFQKARCDVAYCDHSQHWFVREDPRRKDCILHRLAGARRRYRASPAQQRKRQRAAADRNSLRGRPGHGRLKSKASAA